MFHMHSLEFVTSTNALLSLMLPTWSPHAMGHMRQEFAQITGSSMDLLLRMMLVVLISQGFHPGHHNMAEARLRL